MTGNLFDGTDSAVTGRFASMSRLEVAKAIRQSGGRLVRTLSPRTRFLIVGQGELPLGADAQPTSILDEADRLKATGCQLEILFEEDFLKHLSVVDYDDRIRRRHTVIQLARLLGLPGERIRKWLKRGLIEPSDVVGGVALFDFQQVAAARTLSELVDAGLTPTEIRKGLDQLQRMFPGSSPLSRISAIDSTSRILHRLESGLLAEISGQLQLDFRDEPDANGHLTYIAVARTTDELFEDAVLLESSGQLQQAVDTYQLALSKQPDDPVIRFNLGNTLFQLGMTQAAAVEFRRAVQIDPGYVEAWNNLGSMLFELHLVDESIMAFERALRLDPGYQEARANLARVIEMQRDSTETVLEAP
ncbi:MAG TPA: tetratricopeptide repeat protein [Schlesneria sp.]